jgi:hypothetical protein
MSAAPVHRAEQRVIALQGFRILKQESTEKERRNFGKPLIALA